MMPITRPDLEVLLDSPESRDYVVSAFADLRVKDGFRRFWDAQLGNLARVAQVALSEAEARKHLGANMAAIQRAIESADAASRGIAVYSGASRGLFHAVNLDFPVENQLVLDEEPFLLPLLERWYGEPNFLIAVVDSRQLHLFEAHAGVPEEVMEIERDADIDIQRDKPRFTYKKRFAQTQHERLHDLDEDGFFKEVVGAIAERWKPGGFAGLILLGASETTGAVRRLLPRDLAQAVVEEAAQTMTSRAVDVADDVDRALAQWRQHRETTLLDELRQRWKEHNHRVANGPTDVLDALQQGRAAQVIFGTRRDLVGARCHDCGYRFGAPIHSCVYCRGKCRSVNAVQEILRMALRHRVPLHLFRAGQVDDPLGKAGGVAALLRAEANWAPDAATAQASQGH